MRLTNTLLRLLQGIALLLALILAAPLVAQETADETTSGELPAVSAFTAAQDPGLSADQLAILMVPLTATELSEIADVWQGYLRAALDEAARLNLALIEADDPRAKQLREQLASMTKAHRGLIPLYELVLENLDRKGAVSEVTQTHRNFLSAVQADSVRTTDIRTLMRFVTAWLFSFSIRGISKALKNRVMAIQKSSRTNSRHCTRLSH